MNATVRLEHLKKYCSHSETKESGAVFLGFGFVSAQLQGYCEPAPSPKPRQTPKILAPNGYRIFLNALARSNRIVLSRELRRAAGITAGQQFKAFATPGRMVLQVEFTSCGKIAQRGKLKVWTGEVPNTPLAEAIEQMRH